MTLLEAAEMKGRLPKALSFEKIHAYTAGLKQVLILKTLWYPEIVDRLEESARECLQEAKISPEKIGVHEVPGSFELPLAAKMFATASSRPPDFIVALGLILRGETPHFDFVCQAVALGIQQVSLEQCLPIGFGVLTVDTLAQAQARYEKGREAAQAGLLMYCQKLMLRETL